MVQRYSGCIFLWEVLIHLPRLTLHSLICFSIIFKKMETYEQIFLEWMGGKKHILFSVDMPLEGKDTFSKIAQLVHILENCLGLVWMLPLILLACTALGAKPALVMSLAGNVDVCRGNAVFGRRCWLLQSTLPRFAACCCLNTLAPHMLLLHEAFLMKTQVAVLAPTSWCTESLGWACACSELPTEKSACPAFGLLLLVRWGKY